MLFAAYTFAQQDSLNTNERIISFHSDIVVQKNNSIDVVEHIKVYSNGQNIKHGIFRTLPLNRSINGKNQRISYDNISVKRDGVTEDFHTENSNGNILIYMGSRDRDLDAGKYDYELSYHTENQIGFFKDYDEFYWNVSGVNWDFPIENISANIKLPDGVKILQNSCYTGSYGSKEQNCTFNKLSENEIFFSAEDLYENQGLTVAVGFNKGIMIPPPPPTFLEKYGLLILSFLISLGLLVYFYRTWDKFGRDPEKPTVYPQFSVPNNDSPASLGYLKFENFRNEFISASLVNLAIKGFVQIKEIEKIGVFSFLSQTKYRLNKLKDSDKSLPEEEILLMKEFFPAESKSLLLDGQYNSKIKDAVENFEANLKFQHNAFLTKGNNQNKVVLPGFIITFFYFIALYFSYNINPEIEKVVFGVVLFVVLMVILFIIQFIGRVSFSYKFIVIFIFGLYFLSGFGIKLNLDILQDSNFNYCYLFLLFSFSVLVFYSYLIRQPTPEKLQEKSLIEGFKMYLMAAESEVLKFHNPPKMTPEIFEKLLPYAMVLKVEDIWGNKFENVLKNMGETYQNTWFIGNTISPHNFSQSFSSSFSQSVSKASTPPSSSGSGSGGGGFSGGGGGGGGGGGW